MANHVNIYAIADLIDEKPFNMNWFSYDLMGGWGNKLTKYNKKNAAQGITTPGIGNEIGIPKVYKKLKNNDFSDISGFYVGILCFFGEKIYENLDFVEKIPKNSINKVVSGLKCPQRFQEEIKEICYTEYDFLDFISAASKLEKTNFDEESAISVYKLQGNKAIYPLLCQMFYSNKKTNCINPCLIHDVPIDFPVKISNFLSGCHFPVVVSPMVDKCQWKENQNGWFLYGKYQDDWLVLDVVGVGRMNLSNYALTNRLNYLGGGGKSLPYLICWNWYDIIGAYNYFDEDLLVRDLKNNIFDHYWFKFGKKSLLNVRFKEKFINFTRDLQITPNFSPNLITKDKHKNAYLTVDLDGNFVDYCEKNDVCYSDSEVFDWFEIGKQLK